MRTFAQQQNQPQRREASALAMASRNNPYERKADALSDQVLRTAVSAPIASTIQPEPAPAVRAGPELDVGASMRQAGQNGVPLPKDVRSYFEPHFGHDFSRVRI